MQKEISKDLKDLIERTARIETYMEYQKEQFERIERALESVEQVKAKVQSHENKITSFSWLIGIIVTGFIGKYIGKF